MLSCNSSLVPKPYLQYLHCRTCTLFVMAQSPVFCRFAPSNVSQKRALFLSENGFAHSYCKCFYSRRLKLITNQTWSTVQPLFKTFVNKFIISILKIFSLGSLHIGHSKRVTNLNLQMNSKILKYKKIYICVI